MIFSPDHRVYEVLFAEIKQYSDLDCANQWPLGYVKGKEITD